MSYELSIFHSGWGWIGMAVSERGLAGLTLPSPEEGSALETIQRAHPGGVRVDPGRWLELREKLLSYLDGEVADFSGVPLDLPPGPPFWRRVWDACARIPYGETRTYAELACEVGSPRGFRAVGRAMAANPIPIVIPCHRVVGSDGGLVGFAGGLDQKRRLLRMEAERVASASGSVAAPFTGASGGATPSIK
ncbi:MAG TPA: methylated-DNA--[protein]-cysteine S-methyltransferase [Chloroflexota bacterium]